MGWKGTGLVWVAVSLAIVLGASACTRDDAQSHHKQLEGKVARLQDQLQEERERRQKAQEMAEQEGKANREAQKTASTRNTQQKSQSEQAQRNKSACRGCGTVTTIEPIRRNARHGSGLGAVGGGAAGGAIGHQIGHGAGRTAAEIAGALGGATVGNTVEKHIRKETVYRVHVKMDNGQSRVVTVGSARDLARGTRVRVSGSSLDAIH